LGQLQVLFTQTKVIKHWQDVRLYLEIALFDSSQAKQMKALPEARKAASPAQPQV
jgi:hypothetical protein